MSIKVMSQVWELQLNHNDQGVMLALADHADDDGGNCYPSVAYIAWKTGYSIRQVQRVLKQLRGQGLIIPTSSMSGGRHGTVEYQLNLSRVPKKAPFVGESAEPTPTFRRAVIERFHATCVSCHTRGTMAHGPDGQAWHLDRVVPAKAGGDYSRSNVVLACGTCNRQKGAKTAPLDIEMAPRNDSSDAETVPFREENGAIGMAPEPSVEPSIEPSDIYIDTPDEKQAPLDPSVLPDWYGDLFSIPGFKKSIDECVAWLAKNSISEAKANQTAAAVKGRWPGSRSKPYTDAWAVFRNWVMRPELPSNGRPTRAAADSSEDDLKAGWGNGKSR